MTVEKKENIGELDKKTLMNLITLQKITEQGLDNLVVGTIPFDKENRSECLYKTLTLVMLRHIKETYGNVIAEINKQEVLQYIWAAGKDVNYIKKEAEEKLIIEEQTEDKDFKELGKDTVEILNQHLNWLPQYEERIGKLEELGFKTSKEVVKSKEGNNMENEGEKISLE